MKTSVDGTLLAGAQLEPKEPKEEEKMDKLPYLRGLFCFVFCFFLQFSKTPLFSVYFSRELRISINLRIKIVLWEQNIHTIMFVKFHY